MWFKWTIKKYTNYAQINKKVEEKGNFSNTFKNDSKNLDTKTKYWQKEEYNGEHIFK